VTIVAAPAPWITFVNVVHVAARAAICDLRAGPAVLALSGTGLAAALNACLALSLLKFGWADCVAFDKAIAVYYPGL